MALIQPQNPWRCNGKTWNPGLESPLQAVKLSKYQELENFLWWEERRTQPAEKRNNSYTLPFGRAGTPSGVRLTEPGASLNEDGMTSSAAVPAAGYRGVPPRLGDAMP